MSVDSSPQIISNGDLLQPLSKRLRNHHRKESERVQEPDIGAIKVKQSPLGMTGPLALMNSDVVACIRLVQDQASPKFSLQVWDLQAPNTS